MSEKKASNPTVSSGATGSEEKDPEEIREEIEESREELGDTVAAVAEKTDVKKQAKAKADDVKAQASAKAKELGDKAKAATPETPAEGIQQAQSFAKQNPAMAGAGVLVVLLVLWRLLRR